ncbi:MAG: IS4 family transposase [Sulfuritalea sp.]|nr:IS4 family transposase [Sulfuritalea sp.]
MPINLAHLHLWQRTKGKDPKYRNLPIEQKESGRWIDTVIAGKKRLADAAKITVVADRQADVYELWDRLPDARTHLLIRACRDRNLATPSGKTLFVWMDEQPVQGSYRITMPATPKRSAHEALLHVRFGSVTLKKPQHCSDKRASPELTLNVIDVVEDATTVVGDNEPIHWRLLTTHAVATMDDARQCIQWYCLRWHIEQTFRTVKRQGSDLESSQLEHGVRLEKLAVMALSAAVRVMQLTLAREGGSVRPATDAFDADEIKVLQHVQPTLEGNTEKQRIRIRSSRWLGPLGSSPA